VNRRNQKRPKNKAIQETVGKTTSDPTNVSTTVAPEAQKGKQTLVAEAHFFRGPIPHPAVLAQYNTVTPDAANRILGMAERQEAHRQILEKHIVESGVRRADLGLKFGFVLALAFGIGSIYLLAIGQRVEGLTTIFGTIGTIAGSFIYVQISRRRERPKRDKDQDNQQDQQLSLPLE
jgi:uncharacterized membrane protein